MTQSPSYVSTEARAEPFGFACSRCSHCCRDKLIQVNPYEIARLAAHEGVSSAEFRARFTDDGAGVYLARDESGACVFLGPEGCTVHADRPLVCRLYPLGRHITSGGRETFSRAEPHPLSRGSFNTAGTIADFLEAQDVERHIAAADEYFDWFCRAREALEADPEGWDEVSADAHALLDMDTAVAAHCRAAGEPEPTDIDEKRRLHLRILDRQLADIGGS